MFLIIVHKINRIIKIHKPGKLFHSLNVNVLSLAKALPHRSVTVSWTNYHLWSTERAAHRGRRCSLVQEEVLDCVRKEKAGSSVKSIPAQASANTEPTEL